MKAELTDEQSEQLNYLEARLEAVDRAIREVRNQHVALYTERRVLDGMIQKVRRPGGLNLA